MTPVSDPLFVFSEGAGCTHIVNNRDGVLKRHFFHSFIQSFFDYWAKQQPKMVLFGLLVH
jgi:hypothetical protein